jgi:hypothetical protein
MLDGIALSQLKVVSKVYHLRWGTQPGDTSTDNDLNPL